MTKIKAFKALRPVRDKVHLVATRPYYSYKKNVLKAKLEDNPFTFLRIINPEFGSLIKTKPNSPERFNMVSESYKNFIEEGILIQEEKETLYIYRQTKDNQEFTGIIAGASVQEYEDDLIKKHEATLTSREAMFTNYLDIVGYNAEPVLLSYPHQNETDTLINIITAKRPEYEFSTTDRIKHELWILNDVETTEVINAFEKIDACYIADGHHRSASSAALTKLRKKNGNSELNNKDFFLAFFIDERKLKILEFNRIVKSLNGLSKNEFLDKLSISFEIEKLHKQQKPTVEHQITVCIEGDWYLLTCKPEIVKKEHPVKCLDPEILTNYVLDPILGIKDLKTDENIEFISGAESIQSIEDKITKGKFKVAFILYPVSMDQVKRVADNQMIMPPKSTWVEPKMRSGLTIYNINE
jgi:uncharacterized protein (DUF1015 family)